MKHYVFLFNSFAHRFINAILEIIVLVVFRQPRIAPHFFQLVKFAGLGLHYVHYNVHIINQYPFGVLVAFVFKGNLATLVLHHILHVVGNTFYLRTGARLANNKKVCHGLINFSKVEGNNFLSFFFLNSLYNRFKNTGTAGKAGSCAFRTGL
jgi:hypothetical protein